MKIDVEGMELEVLKGGVLTLLTYRPIVYFEMLEEFEAIRGVQLFTQVSELLHNLSYSLIGIDDTGNPV